jgi:hypothetical protein
VILDAGSDILKRVIRQTRKAALASVRRLFFENGSALSGGRFSRAVLPPLTPPRP